jgi:hypothetical protein
MTQAHGLPSLVITTFARGKAFGSVALISHVQAVNPIDGPINAIARTVRRWHGRHAHPSAPSANQTPKGHTMNNSDDEYTRTVKRMRDAFDSLKGEVTGLSQRQDDFNGGQLDVRTELVRLDNQQKEIIRLLGTAIDGILKINRKLEAISEIA